MTHEVYPKFIIEKIDGKLYLILGRVTFHKQLAKDETNVISGGWWVRQMIKNRIILHGSSDQFGKPDEKDIIFCVQHGQVYSDRRLRDNLTEKFDFALDDFMEDIPKIFQTKLTDTELFYAIKNRFKNVTEENVMKAIETINKHLT